MAASCPVFKKLYEERTQRRLNLLYKSDAIRATQGPLQRQPQFLGDEIQNYVARQAGEKRQRDTSPAATQKKVGPGRPRAFDPRNRPNNQTTLTITRTTTPAATAAADTVIADTAIADTAESLQPVRSSNPQVSWADDTLSQAEDIEMN
jgi:hypothetical protein